MKSGKCEDPLTLALSPGVPGEREPDALRGRRLLMVAHSNSAHTGRWARYFQERGMRVRVVSPTEDRIEGVETVWFPGERRWYHRLRGVHLYADYPRWARIVREFGPDVVHVHYPDGGGRNHFYFDSVADRLVVSTWGSEVTESPEFPLNEKHKAGVRAILAKAAVVTATTRYLAEVTARYCAAGRQIQIIPFGVDCGVFKPAEMQAESPHHKEGMQAESLHHKKGMQAESLQHNVRLGFFKNLERKYGPEVLVEAFARIAAECPEARLTMAGKGEMSEGLKRRVRELGLTEKVSFPGRLPHERMVEAMRGTDLFVMPSTCQESFGVAAIEASACEVAVVATRVGGVPEAVVEGVTGLLVPPFDVGALAEACMGLIRDPVRRAALGRAGREFVLGNYQWGRNAATMGEVYRQLFAGEIVRTERMMRVERNTADPLTLTLSPGVPGARGPEESGADAEHSSR